MNARFAGLLLGAVVGLAGSQMASAADMPMKAPIYKAPPVAIFSWTGCYIGVNAGGALNHSDFSTTVDPGTHFGLPANLDAIGAAGTGSADEFGFIGGGQVGCNWQMDSFVVGIEGDFNGLTPEPSQSATAITTLGPVTMTNSTKMDWLATARARLGYAFGRSLLYVTGGAAFTDLKYTQTWSEPAFPAFGTSTASSTRVGGTIGAGWEYAFTNNWSAKAEYLYANFGTVDNDWLLTSSTGTTNMVHGSAKVELHLFRVGLNYRFGP